MNAGAAMIMGTYLGIKKAERMRKQEGNAVVIFDALDDLKIACEFIGRESVSEDDLFVDVIRCDGELLRIRLDVEVKDVIDMAKGFCNK